MKSFPNVPKFCEFILYLNLMKLNSCLYLDQGNQVPQVTLDDLQKYNAGLICLTGGPDGPIGRLLRAGQRPAAEALMDRFDHHFFRMRADSRVESSPDFPGELFA